MTRFLAFALLLAASVIGAVAPGHHASRYGSSGWAGYSGYASTRASSDFIVPNLTGAHGDAVAFWAGFGQGNPGIQQAGITGAVGSGYTAWWEMWPLPAHQFSPPSPPHSGDTMQFVVTRSGSLYTLTVTDVTRHWSVSARQSSSNRELSGEAVAEAFGPSLPSFGPARFLYSNQALTRAYTIPGTTLRKTGSRNFYVSKP